MTFNHLTTENGLQNGNVRAIYEDYQGFMWIATEDGLHRFDGYGIKVYRHKDGDATSLSSNFVLALYEDSFHNLWIGTIDGGLCLYNRKRDNFTTFNHDPEDSIGSAGNTVRSFFQASDWKIYVGSSGFNRITYNSENDNPIRIENIKLPSWIPVDPQTRILSIIEIRKGILWLTVNNFGVVEYNIAENSFRNTILSELEQNVQTLFIDKKRNLVWAGTWDRGLVIVDPVTNEYTWRRKNGSPDELQTDLQITRIKADREGNIFVGTDKGLSFFNSENDPFQPGGFITYLPQKSNPMGIIGTAIKAIYIDRQDRIWVGSYFEGINVYDKKSMAFEFLDLTHFAGSDQPHSNVTSIIQQDPQTLWIGCDGRGLFKVEGDLYGNQNPKFHSIPLFLPPSNAPVAKIKAMELDQSGNLWIGTWGDGLVFYDVKNNQSKSFHDIYPASAIGNEVLSLFSDGDYLWIGTFDHGLFRYDLKKNVLKKYNAGGQNQEGKSDRINFILVDRNKNLWVGKEAAGLNRKMPEDSIYKPVMNDVLEHASTVTSLFEDRQGYLWIGILNKGLVKYDPTSDSCWVYGEQQGLANNVIHSVQEDNANRLWLSTNLGISVFDKGKEKFTNFNKANGLLGNQFNPASHVKLSDGTLLFGNTRGINFFKPEQYAGSESFPDVVFTEFYLNNVAQLPGGENSVLKENITLAKEIRLRHFNNSFSITYAALDYAFSNQTEFAYMLEEFDQDWQYVGTRRQASYTNLDPGKYILKVKASNAEKEWSDRSFDIAIRIMPAWWQTTAFKIGVLLAVLFTGLTVHRLRIRYLVSQKEKLSILVEEKTKDLDETNQILRDKIVEINEINTLILEQKNEILEKNDEIQAQNEELIAQNEQIVEQREELIDAQKKLKSINETLEKLVNEKTEALQVTIKKLNKTVFELDRFVYSASHDLMAPLKSIRGLVRLTELEKDHSRTSEYLHFINNSIFKLEEVVKSLSEYSKNTHQEFKLQDINLYDLICEVRQELAFLPSAQVMKFTFLFKREISIICDRTRLKIILHNLINNAIKYADLDRSPEIAFDVSEMNDAWELTLSDNGIGIKEKYLPKIFNMYFRATDTSSGSGLGLFIVNEVLDKLGGSIRVNSEYGRSTTFTITLPKAIGSK